MKASKHLKKYAIPLSGMKDGKHDFNFVVNALFFEEFESLNYTDGEVDITIILQKSPGVLRLQIYLEGYLVLPCDRCLEEYEQKIENNGDIFVKLTDNEDFEEHDIFVMAQSSQEINVAQLIFDYINLSIPYRCIHPKNENGDDTCNKEMIKKLEEYVIEENEEDQEIDPRWDKLKNLLN